MRGEKNDAAVAKMRKAAQKVSKRVIQEDIDKGQKNATQRIAAKSKAVEIAK